MLPEDLARSGDPRLVVPHLCSGSVPPPVGREDRFHLEFGKPLHDVARAPDPLDLIVRFADIVRLEEPVELVVGLGIIFRAYVGVEELRGGLAGLFFGGIGIARDEDECVVAGHRGTSILIPKLTRCSHGRARCYLPIEPIYGKPPRLHRDFQGHSEIRRAARTMTFVETRLEASRWIGARRPGRLFGGGIISPMP